jgi:hypothetical protein
LNPAHASAHHHPVNSESVAVTPACPRCKNTIPNDDINVASDIAYCRTCNVSYKLSALTLGAALDSNLDLHNPPPGAWYRNDGMQTVIGATHRSLGTAIGALLFGLFWNGIVSIFVLVATAGTIRNLHIPLPDWFPAPNMNGSPMGVGMTLFLWIFLIPFILVGLAMIGVFLSSIAGRTEVRVSNTEAVVFTGIGTLGYRRRFSPSSAQNVRIDDQTWRDSDGARQRKACIDLDRREGKPLKFASMLTDERRKFMAGALRRTLRIAG